MAILSAISIRGSVGYRAKNDSTDVRTIQTRLNALMKPPRAQLTVDGRSGPKTEQMIFDFQKVVVRMGRPDAVVDPGGATLRALNDPSSESKWAQASAPPPSTPAPSQPGGITVRYPANASPIEKQTIDLLAQSAAASGDPAAMQVLDMMTQDEWYKHFKNALNGIGAAQWASEFGYAIKGMKNVGMTTQDILWLFKTIANSPLKDGKAFSQFFAMMKGRPELAGAVGRLKKGGNVLNVAAVIFCAIEVVNHFNAGRPGAALAEIYGTTMQMALPWAGAIDAVQSVAEAYAPGLKSSPAAAYFFRLLNAINPIGCGKTAVDAVTTIIETAIVSHQKGTFDTSKLELLVSRMKNTPMNVFVGWGETLGDYMGDKFGDFYYEHFLK